MYYCEPCRVEQEWPESVAGSVGTCELCRDLTRCHDRPAATLPAAKPFVITHGSYYVSRFTGTNQPEFVDQKVAAAKFATARVASRELARHPRLVGTFKVVPLVLTEVDRVVGELLRLTPDQRAEAFRQFCRECGSDDKDCVCWNDE